MKEQNTTIGEVYLHISNSGVTFRIEENPKIGPVIHITSGAFGNIWQDFLIKTNTESLALLGAMFLECSKHPFNGNPDDGCPAKATLSEFIIPSVVPLRKTWSSSGSDGCKSGYFDDAGNEIEGEPPAQAIPEGSIGIEQYLAKHLNS